MKKIIITFGLLMVCFSLVSSTVQNPFDSIFGMKWGTTAMEVKDNFKWDLNPAPGNKPRFLMMCDFPLGDINIEVLNFFFKTSKYFEPDWSKYYLNETMMFITPANAEPLFNVIVKKYGKPFEIKEYIIKNSKGVKLNQKEVLWKNGDRAIKYIRYINVSYSGWEWIGRFRFYSIKDDADKIEMKKPENIL